MSSIKYMLLRKILAVHLLYTYTLTVMEQRIQCYFTLKCYVMALQSLSLVICSWNIGVIMPNNAIKRDGLQPPLI